MHLQQPHVPDFLAPHLAAGSRVLDVGCGQGENTLEIARVLQSRGGSAEQVHGLDVSEERVGVAKEKAEEAQLNVSFSQGSATELPFEDDSFDVAVASQVLHHVTDPLAALKELQRVVRPGGIVVARDFDFGALLWYPPAPGLSRWRAIFSVVSDLEGMQPNAGRHLGMWFHRTGFQDTQLSSSNLTFGSPEERQHLATLWAERTQESHYVEKATQALGDATPEAITQVVEGWHTWADTPGALFIMPIVEAIGRV